jgi:hypothetical protein
MKRTIEIDVPITPRELAEAFCDMMADEQEQFLAQVYDIAKTWPGAGWCRQSCSIVQCATPYAIETIRTLASHLPKEDVEWIVAASQDGSS